MMRSVTAALAACAIAGCGSGTPAVHQAPPAAQTPGTPAKTASSTLTIAIPLPKGAASTRRAPHFVSSGTASGGIAVGYNIGPQYISQAFDLSASSPNCTTANGVRTCTMTVDLPLGNDTIALFTYDGPLSGGKPSGHMLAMSTVTAGIIEGKHNSVAMSLLGVPAAVTIVPAQSSVASMGTAVTVALTTTVYDAAGNEITGTDPYSEPVAIQASGTRGALSVLINGNPNSGYLTRPGDTAAIAYAGRGGSGAYAIRASIFYGNNQIGSAPFTITPGMRLAQQIFTNLAHAVPGPALRQPRHLDHRARGARPCDLHRERHVHAVRDRERQGAAAHRLHRKQRRVSGGGVAVRHQRGERRDRHRAPGRDRHARPVTGAAQQAATVDRARFDVRRTG